MSILLRYLEWFGLRAIHETGRNAYLILAARCLRMTAHGAISLILALFLSALEFSDYQIGLFLTLTLLGDVFLGGVLTLIADRTGRRNVLIGGSMLMVTSGLTFAFVSNFWVLLFAAVVGVVSATGGDFGPFRSIEESILSHLTTPRTRAEVLSWYVSTSIFGAALGSELSGRIIHALQDRGWELIDAYHAMFLGYVLMGTLNATLSFLLTDACEIQLQPDDNTYSQVPQEELEQAAATPNPPENLGPLQAMPLSAAKQNWLRRGWKGLSSRLSQISAPTRKIMYKLWFLLAIDSLADGMVPFSLTNYYMEEKFHPTKSSLGDINGIAYLLGAVATVFAGPLARKIGLINTMVFTHVPSSAAVLVFPFPPTFWLTVILLFIRAGLNSLDQAPRSAFIAAVVKADERTAVMGITAVVRTLAATTGPTVTGFLAGSDRFWIAFVAAGVCRLVYDFGLYALFINTKLYQHEGGAAVDPAANAAPRLSDEEMELESLAESDEGSDESPEKKSATEESSAASKSPRLMPRDEQQQQRVRRRSPSPLAKVHT